MFPWFWYFAPQVHFPWSGSVAQHIAPDTDWFFAGIAPEAGDARIEQQAFAVASYGRQLGLITEVLLDLAAQVVPASPKARESVSRLQAIRAEIEQLKDAEVERVADALAEQVRAIQQRGGAKAQALNARLRPLLR
jgi:peptidoglycan hydrolase CwlO-like protein